MAKTMIIAHFRNMLILKNAYVIQFHPAVVEGNKDIIIDGSEIIDVGQNIAANYPDAKVTDLNGDMVTPGIVCSHNHFYSGLARGIMANIKPCPDFISILINLWWRLDRAIDEEILYSSGMVCVLDAIKTGTTSVIDQNFFVIRFSAHAKTDIFERKIAFDCSP